MGRTRTLLMKSRISLTNWEMVDAPSISWTNNAAAWKLRKKSSNLPLKKLRLLLNKKRTRFLELNLSLDKFAKRDRGIQEKEEEFDNTRKNHQRAMDSLAASLEGEQRAKGEALRVKKKLESDINELEIALDHANKANAE